MRTNKDYAAPKKKDGACYNASGCYNCVMYSLPLEVAHSPAPSKYSVYSDSVLAAVLSLCTCTILYRERMDFV